MDLKTAPPTFDVAPTTTKSPSAIQDIAFGSFAGTIGKVVEYPFDTVKVRLQSQPDHLPLRYTGPVDCFRQSLLEGGVRNLYRGVSAPLVGAALETASLFYAYSLSQQILRAALFPARRDSDALPLPWLVTAGAMSGGITSVILTPIELIKCRMQAPSTASAKTLSPFTVIADVFRRDGLKGFWRGQLGTFLRETGGTAAWFGGYEATCSYLQQRLARQRDLPPSAAPQIELPLAQNMLAGALAGVSYNFLFFPADTIKSKMQTTEARTGFLEVGRDLWRAHGLKGLYRGCGITVARSAPSSALIFTIVEKLKQNFT